MSSGARRLGADEEKLGDIVHGLAKGARSTTAATAEHLGDAKERARGLAESAWSVARSIESLGDLERRVRAHGGELVDAARSFSRQVADVLSKMAESPAPRRDGDVHPSDELDQPAEDASGGSDVKDD